MGRIFYNRRMESFLSTPLSNLDSSFYGVLLLAFYYAGLRLYQLPYSFCAILGNKNDTYRELLPSCLDVWGMFSYPILYPFIGVLRGRLVNG